MTELRINGHERVRDILMALLPFLKFKKKQAEVIIRSANLLLSSESSAVATKEKLVDNILIIQSENYASRKKRSKQELRELLGLTP
jgi:hypothetical protein